MIKALPILFLIFGLAAGQQEFASRATTYDHADFKGQMGHYQMQWGQCQNLPAAENDRISSINTHGTCILMWEHGGCSGDSKRVAPGTGGHSWVGSDWNDRVTSLSPC